MIDFKDMEYGIIKTSTGVVLVLQGTFYGPFNKKQFRMIIEGLKEQLNVRNRKNDI